tara:strand:- start:65 stop:988 length:924 start_codon:yes stop_codon:yes gene_type:complete
MKVYLSKINESWVVDRMRDEWYEYNKNISTQNPKDADVIWIISPWLWEKEPKRYLKSKKVICSVFHMEEIDFSEAGINKFKKRDKYVDCYHVISLKTKKQLASVTDKEIIYIPFWVNSKIWFEIKNKTELREKYGIKKNSFVVGSFQRDTEGKDLVSPKLIKGPDRFVSIVKRLNIEKKDLTILLAGKRRQYVISKLEEENINYVYLEMVDFETLNELYNTLDLYIVTSRIEGGPQSIVECGISKTPIISTDVGIASEILNKKSIFNMENFLNAEPIIETAYKNSVKLAIPRGFVKYSELFKSLVIK